MSLSLPFSAFAQRRERAASGFRLFLVPRRLLLAADARFAERHLGLGRAGIRIERERQRLRHRFADVDQRAVIEDHVHLAFMELRSEEHTSELQSLMRISYAVFCLKKKNKQTHN